METMTVQMFEAWAKILKEQCELSECGKCPFYKMEDCYCVIRQITCADPPCDWEI